MAVRTLPSMRARRAGSIINVSSVAALNYFPGLMAYGMAKAALDHRFGIGAGKNLRDLLRRAPLVARPAFLATQAVPVLALLAAFISRGPASLLPTELAQIAPGVSLTYDIREAIRDADVVMMLRVQLERQHEAAFASSE